MSYDRHQYPSPHDDHGPPLLQSSSTLSGALDIHREQSHGDSVHAQLSSPSKEHDQRRAHELPTTAEQWFLPSPPEAPSSRGRSSLAHALQWPSTPARQAVPPTCSTPVKRTSEMQWEPDSAFEVNTTPSWTAVQDTSPTASPFPFTFVSNPASRREGWAEQRATGTSQQYQPTKLGGPAMGFNAAQWGSAGIDHSRYATWPAGARQTAISDDDLHHPSGMDGIGSGLGEGLDQSPSIPILRSRHDNSQSTSPLGGKQANSYDIPPDRDAESLPFGWANASTPSAVGQPPSALYPALPGLTQGLQTLGLTLDQLTTLGPADDTHNDSQLSINTTADSMLSSPDFDNSWETSLSAEQSSMESSFASSRTPPQMKGWCDPSVSLSLAPPRGGHMLEVATPRSFPVAGGFVPPAALPVNLEANQHAAADNGLPPRSSSPRPFASASQAAPLDLMDERLPWGPPPSPSSSSGCDFADPHSQAPSSAQPEPSKLAELLGSDAMIQIQAKLGSGPPSIRAGPAQSATAVPSHVAHQATAQARMRQAQDKIGTEEVLVALKNLRMFLQGTDDQQHLRSVIELESSIIQSRDVQISGSSADPPPPSEATKSATMVAPCPPGV